MLLIRIREMLGSHLSQDIGYPEIFRCFPLPIQANARIIPQLSHEHFLASPFQIIIHLFI
jgi:hypothetical protein